MKYLIGLDLGTTAIKVGLSMKGKDCCSGYKRVYVIQTVNAMGRAESRSLLAGFFFGTKNGSGKNVQ